MLDMGEPVPIIDLARRMIQLSGARIDVDIPIKVVGIRPGEKLRENLREPEEQVLATEHASISRLIPITSPPAWFETNLDLLGDATRRRDPDKVRRLLFAIAGVEPEQDIHHGPATPEIEIEIDEVLTPSPIELRLGAAGDRAESKGA